MQECVECRFVVCIPAAYSYAKAFVCHTTAIEKKNIELSNKYEKQSENIMLVAR
jgi:hypothetical protein